MGMNVLGVLVGSALNRRWPCLMGMRRSRVPWTHATGTLVWGAKARLSNWSAINQPASPAIAGRLVKVLMIMAPRAV